MLGAQHYAPRRAEGLLKHLIPKYSVLGDPPIMTNKTMRQNLTLKPAPRGFRIREDNQYSTIRPVAADELGELEHEVFWVASPTTDSGPPDKMLVG